MKLVPIFLTASALAGCAGSGEPKVEEAKAPVIESGPVGITNVGLRIHLTKLGKDYVIGKTGFFRFQQKLGSTPGAELQCEIPVIFTLTGPRKALDAAISKSVKEVFKKTNRPLEGTTQEFTTGFFTVSGDKVSPLIQSTPDSLLGKYEMRSIPGLAKFGPGATSAPVNQRAIGFALPVGDKFKDPVTLTLDLNPADDSATNALCQRILKSGFKIEAPKQDA